MSVKANYRRRQQLRGHGIREKVIGTFFVRMYRSAEGWTVEVWDLSVPVFAPGQTSRVCYEGLTGEEAWGLFSKFE